PLSPPTLRSPLNGSTGVPTQPSFSWQSVTNADNYRILVATDAAALPTGTAEPGSSSSLVINLPVGNTTSFTPSTALTAGTPYVWEVRASNSTTGGTWSNQFTFTTAAGPHVETASVSQAHIAIGGTLSTSWTTSGIVHHVRLYLLN